MVKLFIAIHWMALPAPRATALLYSLYKNAVFWRNGLLRAILKPQENESPLHVKFAIFAGLFLFPSPLTLCYCTPKFNQKQKMRFVFAVLILGGAFSSLSHSFFPTWVFFSHDEYKYMRQDAEWLLDRFPSGILNVSSRRPTFLLILSL